MTSELTENNDTEQEQLLRGVLRDHAPGNIDVVTAWETTVPRLMFAQVPSEARQSHSRARARLVMPGMKRLLHGPRMLVLAATAIIVVLLLAGAAFGTAYWGGLFGGDKAKLIGDERLYTTINQSQTVSGITITIDKVYADPGNTYIAMTIRLPRSMAGTYKHAYVDHIAITNVNGQHPSGLNEVSDPLSDDGTVAYSLFDTAPLPPNPDASHLTLTFDIGQVLLDRPGQANLDVRSGPWHFTFTVPYHQQNLGPGGPYAQPAPSQKP